MEETTARTIRQLKDWGAISRLEKNARQSGRFTQEIEKALGERGLELALAEVVVSTGIEVDSLSSAESRVVQAVTGYLALKRKSGSHAQYTLDQIRRRGLLGAVETSVIKPKPTAGFNKLVEADLAQLSYEQIVLDFPSEFSSKALRYARRTLGMEELPSEDVLVKSSKTQAWTEVLIAWLRDLAEENGGILPAFSNADAAAKVGIADLSKYGRAYGNLQSRLDYACFRLMLPALGLAADTPFAAAWDTGGRDWSFPVETMQRAARTYVWQANDFDQLLIYTRTLSGRSPSLWHEALSEGEGAVKQWAFGPEGGYGTPMLQPPGSPSPRPPRWSRDELILALDLYFKNRAAPPGKDSNEVAELSATLNKLGQALGTARGGEFRNANGVYMKMMNFRRFDPEFTKDGKVGLTRGNKDEEVVWNEFSNDLGRLRQVAAAIRKVIGHGVEGNDSDSDDDLDAVEAREGRLLTRVHRSRERSRAIVEQKKKKHLKTHGKLFCEACGFEFGAMYGAEVEHVIDCHHTKPVHTMADGDVTRLDDLVLLCANCHRVVHASSPWLTMDRLRALINLRR